MEVKLGRKIPVFLRRCPELAGYHDSKSISTFRKENFDVLCRHISLQIIRSTKDITTELSELTESSYNQSYVGTTLYSK